MTTEASHLANGNAPVQISGDVQAQTPAGGNTIRRGSIAVGFAALALTLGVGISSYLQNRNGGGNITDEPTRAWNQVHGNGTTDLTAGEGATPVETASDPSPFVSDGENKIGKTDSSAYEQPVDVKTPNQIVEYHQFPDQK